MNALALTINGERGYLFRTTHGRDIIAFVPEAHLSVEWGNEMEFDQATYLSSGWAAKNARFNIGEASKYTFPLLDYPVLHAEENGVASFLQRIRHAYVAALETNSTI